MDLTYSLRSRLDLASPTGWCQEEFIELLGLWPALVRELDRIETTPTPRIGIPILELEVRQGGNNYYRLSLWPINGQRFRLFASWYPPQDGGWESLAIYQDRAGLRAAVLDWFRQRLYVWKETLT